MGSQAIYSISLAFDGKDTVIYDDGGDSPHVLGVDDHVLIDGQLHTLRAAGDFLRTLGDVTNRAPIGMSFDELGRYLAMLQTVAEGRYAADEKGCQKFPVAIAVAALSPYIGGDGLTVSAVVDRHRRAMEDVDGVANELAAVSDTSRRAMLQYLVAHFALEPRRTYQPDPAARFDEVIVAAMAEHLRTSDDAPVFPLEEWMRDQTHGVRGGHPATNLNAAGAEYWHAFIRRAAAVGTTPERQATFFSAPRRLALVLRAAVAPKAMAAVEPYRLYANGSAAVNALGVVAFAFGPVAFYGIDGVVPNAAVMATVMEQMEQAEVDFNPVQAIVFTPAIHGERVSVAQQGRFAIADPLVPLLGIDGDYIRIGLDATRIPACTTAHELGHQFYWQIVESPFQTTLPGSSEAACLSEIQEIYAAAMATDGGELINDETYTGLYESGHPYLLVEFFPAARHAFVHHADAFARRVAETPPTHYAHRLWGLMEHLYGRTFE